MQPQCLMDKPRNVWRIIPLFLADQSSRFVLQPPILAGSTCEKSRYLMLKSRQLNG